MYCHHCGAALRAEARFCSKCGVAIANEVTQQASSPVGAPGTDQTQPVTETEFAISTEPKRMRRRPWRAIILVIVPIVVLGIGGFFGWRMLTTLKAGDVRVNPKDSAKMVWVPAGDFLMGSTDQQINDWLHSYPWKYHEAFKSEQPQHKVYLDGYWIYM